MVIAIQAADMHLAKRALVQLADSAQQISCRSGTVWITQQDDPRDIVLEAGQSFTPDGHRHIVVYALTAARLTVQTAPTAPAPVRKPHRRWERELVLE